MTSPFDSPLLVDEVLLCFVGATWVCLFLGGARKIMFFPLVSFQNQQKGAPSKKDRPTCRILVVGGNGEKPIRVHLKQDAGIGRGTEKMLKGWMRCAF